VAVQSVDAAREYVNKLRVGATIAFMHHDTEGQKKGFWLARKVSEIVRANEEDATTGVKKGEEILHILWYDCVQGLKYKLLEDETVASLSSVIVTVSDITWLKTTTRRFYLGESTDTMLIDIVNSMSEL